MRRLAKYQAMALAVALASLLLAPWPSAAQAADAAAGPRFRVDGPDADTYGRNEGYPSCVGLAYFREMRCRVGAFSNFENLVPSRIIAAPQSPSPLGRAVSEPSFRYTHIGKSLTLDQYLDAQPVTGFLIAWGDRILVERYQYGRTDKQRLTSFSMAKTVIALLIGIAVSEGAINSVNDLAEVYVPGLKGAEFGRTPIKALLQMTSGVSFREEYSNLDSDVYTLANLTLGQDPGGSLAALPRFNTRLAPPGQRFSYSSAESLVLGLVLAGATGRTVSDYASEKLWRPLGAEADATWAIDATGQEITFAYVSATLRDWARLGLMLAHGGVWQGKTIIPRAWLLESTEPGSPFPGYGYQVWLPHWNLPSDRRLFALRGVRGQWVIVDPETKLVLVQTALANDGLATQELMALWSSLPAQLQ